jgi:hypothetical protein
MIVYLGDAVSAGVSVRISGASQQSSSKLLCCGMVGYKQKREPRPCDQVSAGSLRPHRLHPREPKRLTASAGVPLCARLPSCSNRGKEEGGLDSSSTHSRVPP